MVTSRCQICRRSCERGRFFTLVHMMSWLHNSIETGNLIIQVMVVLGTAVLCTWRFHCLREFSDKARHMFAL